MLGPAIPPNVKVLSVSELTLAVKGLLEEAFPVVWVAGEVSNLARPSSGHLYFSLKDAQAQLKSVMWRSIALRMRFDLHDGLEVIARGRLSVYQPRGEYQLNVEELYPKGLGALELALRQLKEKLFVRGWFDPTRKKPLPRVPRRLALVTSPTGAAVRDMLEILARRWPSVEVIVCPVRVQGEGAAQEIAAGVRLLNRLHRAGRLPLDVMILGRGGGSIEDLWAFNEECVAEAIHDSVIPVVSAVGHEVDVTIADLVADHRAPTPSAAAAHVVPDRTEVLHGLHDTEGRLHDAMRTRLDLSRQRLDDLAARRAFRLPLERVRDWEQRLDDWGGRLARAARQRLALARQRLDGQAARLEGLSPLNVLARGYSLTRREADLAVVRDPVQLQLGDRLVTLVHQGTVVSRVEELQAGTATSASRCTDGPAPAVDAQHE
jgi:exodeoxyribonuclease VII large subunit